MKIISRVKSERQLSIVMAIVFVFATIVYYIIDAEFGSSRLLNSIYFISLIATFIILGLIWKIVEYKRMKSLGKEHVFIKTLIEDLK